MSNMRHIILDSDMGLDDAHCLVGLLLSSKLCTLEAICTVFGNTTIDQCNLNARVLLTAFGREDIPIYSGASKSIASKYLEPWAGMGEFALGGADFSTYIRQLKKDIQSGDINEYLPPLQKETAAEALVRLTLENPNKYDILSIGPLTNIAQAIALDSKFPSRVRSLVWMGGEILPDHPIEFNAEACGISVRDVFAKWPARKLTVVPFSLTANAALSWDFYDHITRFGSAYFAKVIKSTTATYEKFVRQVYVPFESQLHQYGQDNETLPRKYQAITSECVITEDGNTNTYTRIHQEYVTNGIDMSSGFSSCDFYAFLTLIYPESVDVMTEKYIQGLETGALILHNKDDAEKTETGSVQYVVEKMDIDKVHAVFEQLTNAPKFSQ